MQLQKMKEGTPRRVRASVKTGCAIALMMAAAMSGAANQASAQQTNFVIPGDDDSPPPCAPNFANMTTSRSTVTLGQSATLQWTVLVPSGCPMPSLYLRDSLTGQSIPVDAEDSLVVTPSVATTYTLRTLQTTLRSKTVNVTVPTDGTGTVVTITANHQQQLLIQALGVPNMTVVVQNHVQMDLSNYPWVPIAGGVRFQGGRTPRQPGARFYLRYNADRPHLTPMFRVLGDNVRISGLRFDGGDPTYSKGPRCLFDDGWPECRIDVGILVVSMRDVEIFNNEFTGWSSSGLRILDFYERLDRFTPAAVWIHENFFHHNERVSKGYGVNVGDGAYALIEKNVFDYNRHAIASDGTPGTGYFAHKNLVLEHGGKQTDVFGVDFYTHQFDMHGTDDCGIFAGDTTNNCGPAGELVDVRDNSFYNEHGPSFKIRGTPSIGAFVISNVSDQFRDLYQQHETGMIESENIIRIRGQGSCDFDGDGLDDEFMTTGRTWWFNSGGDRHWVYLHASTLHIAGLMLRDVTGDGKCDVVADGVTYPGGRP